MLSDEQKAALNVVATAFGWDQRTEDEMRLIAWSAFHYYAARLTPPWSNWIQAEGETVRESPQATLRALRGPLAVILDWYEQIPNDELSDDVVRQSFGQINRIVGLPSK